MEYCSIQYVKVLRFLSCRYIINSTKSLKINPGFCDIFVVTIVGHSENFLVLAVEFHKDLKVSFVRPSRKSNFVIAPNAKN